MKKKRYTEAQIAFALRQAGFGALGGVYICRRWVSIRSGNGVA
jgi:hypothetical protein